MYNIEELNIRLISELREIAEQIGVKNFKKFSKEELVYKILDEQAVNPDAVKEVTTNKPTFSSMIIDENKQKRLSKQ